MIEVWVLTIALTYPSDYGGMNGFGRTDLFQVKVPTQVQCENIRTYMKKLNEIVPDYIRPGNCQKVLKDENSSIR